MNTLMVASIGTIHLSLQTREWMEKLDWANEGPSGGNLGYGFFLYCHDENYCHPSPPHAPEGEFPADLWACIEAARAAGCSHIRFDRDEEAEEPEEELNTYDDLPAAVNEQGRLMTAQNYDIVQRPDGSWRLWEIGAEDDESEVFVSLPNAQDEASSYDLLVRRTVALEGKVS